MTRAYVVGIAALALLLSVGCASQALFFPGPLTPAAEASARFTRDANENTKLQLRVKHLALPQRLSQPKAFYVVWAQSPQGQSMKLGRLMVKSNKTGVFKSVIPLDVFRLLITAEDGVDAPTPSDQVVLSTQVLRAKTLNQGFWQSLKPRKTSGQ
jgi:hypothetical protein